MLLLSVMGVMTVRIMIQFKISGSKQKKIKPEIHFNNNGVTISPLDGICLDVFRKIFRDNFSKFKSLKEFVLFLKNTSLISKIFYQFIKKEYLIKYCPSVHISIADIKKDIRNPNNQEDQHFSPFIPVYFGLPILKIEIVISDDLSSYMLRNYFEDLNECLTTYSFGMNLRRCFPKTKSITLVLLSCSWKQDLFYERNFRFYFPVGLNTKTSSIILYSEKFKKTIEILQIDPDTLLSRVSFYHICFIT